MPAKGFQLYFIAIIPPSPIREEVWALKEYFRDTYQSKASLNSPPHITLHMPFQWKEKRTSELVSGLEQFYSQGKIFTIDLSNFGCFPPRVIYVGVKDSVLLTDLQKKLMQFCKIEFNIFNSRYRDLPYHPHLTLAFRDLKKSKFQLAWKEFENKSFAASFEVDKFALLKHNGKCWDVFREFSLASKN